MEIGLLMDFYGQLLTERQYEILDLHYNNDYSLGEIAENLKISRQGVFDNLKRGKNALYNLEEKLGLVKRFLDQKKSIEEIKAKIDCIDMELETNRTCDAMDRVRADIKLIKSKLEKIVNEN